MHKQLACFCNGFFYSSLNNIKIQFSNLRWRYITPFLPVTTNIETTYQNIPSKIICTCSCIRRLTNHFCLFSFVPWRHGWCARLRIERSRLESWGPFLESSETFSHPKSRSKVLILMITKLFYSHTPNMNRSYLHTESLRRTYPSVFK